MWFFFFHWQSTNQETFIIKKPYPKDMVKIQYLTLLFYNHIPLYYYLMFSHTIP